MNDSKAVIAYLTDDEGLICLRCWGIGGPSDICPRCSDTLRDCICDEGIPHTADELGEDAACELCDCRLAGN